MSATNKKSVAVIGLWHLGCTVAASLAKSGARVIGLDFSTELIKNLNKAEMPIEELGLSELTKEMLRAKQLSFSTDFALLKGCGFIVIGYDTPVGEDDRPDLRVVEKAIRQIAKNAGPNSTVIIMSQIPAGTSRKYYNLLKKTVKGIELVYNPENVRLSQAIETYLNADRQIIGVSAPEAEKRMKEFYSFYKNPLLFMSLESAELVKHGVNSFLAMSVSFINQLADLAEKLDANILEVVKGLKTDTRIGQKAFFSAGLGFAGGTLGRDLRVLESLAKNNNISLPLISDVYKINQDRKIIFMKKVKKVFPSLKGKTVAILGLVYKPGTNTLRRSLSLEIGKLLLKQGAVVNGFDPALKNEKDILPIKLKKNAYEAAHGADMLIVITEWPEFKELDFFKIKQHMKKPIIFDTKNILPVSNLKNLGYKYFGTGVGNGK